MNKYIRITYATISKKCQALTLVEAQRHKDIPKGKKKYYGMKKHIHMFFN